MNVTSSLQGPVLALFESGLLGVYLSTVDGCFLEVNRAFLDMTGYQETELERLGIPGITSEEDWARTYNSRRKILRGEAAHFSEEKRITRKDGRIIRAQGTFSLWHRNPPQFITFVEELGAREALRESQRHRYAIFDNSRDAMLLFDDDGRYVEANHAAEEIFGRSAGEIVGSQLGSLAPHAAFAQTIFEQFRNDNRLRLEWTVQHPDGSFREVESIFSPSVVDGIHLCIARDVTARKSLERQLQQAQRIEAVGRLAGGVAHDINNMLTVVRGYSEMMKRKTPIDSALHRYSDMIISAADRSSNITQQLLAFSRRQVVQPRVLDLRNVVVDVLKLLSNLLGEDVAITTSLAQDTGRIFADTGQVGQLLMNLAVNARDAMPNGGTLRVETRRETLKTPPDGSILPIEPGTYAVLSVSDTGSGIPDESRSHVFEPFFTTKELGKGTGLGLATVYAIIEQSKGTIVLNSEMGVGTTFNLYLPTVSDELLQVNSAFFPRIDQ